jgi:GNAT superfamily N-acetyltransferase
MRAVAAGNYRRSANHSVVFRTASRALTDAVSGCERKRWRVTTCPTPPVGDPLTTRSELVRLRDDSTVAIRPVQAEDEPALRLFFSGLCPEARHLRFFSAGVDLTSAAHLCAITDERHFGLMAHDSTGKVVGHAIFVRVDKTRAEVAAEVADHLHGLGLGTILIERLAAVAQAQGIDSFIAEVLPENRTMLDVFRDGFDAHIRLENGTDKVRFSTGA